jgi:TonB-dependent SusC/RagA subfamily outer membrane receptor
MKTIYTLVAAALMANTLHSQTRVIHGKLTAFNTYPVQHIEVSSKKGKSATESDSLGRFSIVCMEHDVIKIKPKAFRPVSRRVDPDTDSLVINLVFIDSKKNRDIAVGYGYVKEKDLTYAVSNLQQENNEYCHYSNVYELIRGRFAGVVVENNQVIIRGRNSINSSTEALYVVDGATVNSIDWISPCDISSINILKDASSSVYGSRGSNGVVIIETKRGL